MMMHRLNNTGPGFLLALLLVFMMQSAAAAVGYKADLLVETDELAALLEQPNVVLVDTENEDVYQRIHIPGAVNLFYNLFSDLETRRKNGFPVEKEEAEKLLGGAGIDNDTLVILYDRGDGAAASGVWFPLHFFGHEKVRLLNGGFRKWMKEGRAVTQEVPEVERKTFAARPRPELVITRQRVREMMEQDVVMLDARSRNEFIGKDLLPGIKRGGHIPGAVHLDWVNLSGELETFKSPDDLQAILAGAGVKPGVKVVNYCHQGIGRATFMHMVMMLAGYDDMLLYMGSWQDWSADRDLPVEK